MKSFLTIFALQCLIILYFICDLNYSQQLSVVPRHYFFQFNNINTVFSNDGVFNLDRVNFNGIEAGLIWPTSAPTRKTLVFTSGIWIGTQLIMQNNQREFRFSGASFEGHYSPGIIPVPGQVPPISVCNDTAWKGYLVCLTDSTLFNGGTRIKIAGGRQYSFQYSSWASWPVFAGAPYVEINNIPGYQPGWNSDRPGIGDSYARPDELLLLIMMDYTNCNDSVRTPSFGAPGGTKPIGVEIHQLVFMFSHPALYNAYFIKWKLINKSAKVMDSTYFGAFLDPDVGNAFDDAKGCDSVRQVGFNYNADDLDPDYGTSPPAVGFNFLQTPVIRTNNNSDTAKIYCDTIVGSKQIGLTTFGDINKSGDSCRVEPSYAVNAYNFMKGLDGCGVPFINYVTGKTTKFKYSGDACNRIGWLDSFMHDTRALISSGPFTMQPLDTQIVVAAFYAAKGTSNFNSVCKVLEFSDDIKVLYPYLVCGYPIIGINNNGNIIPLEFKLNQNFPNPFNPLTQLSFAIPHDNTDKVKVLLIIYDILGREVITLLNQPLSPGEYEINFNGTNYPSGIYFCRLSAGNFSQTIKMVLLK